mgnify:CR=1 FL=1
MTKNNPKKPNKIVKNGKNNFEKLKVSSLASAKNLPNKIRPIMPKITTKIQKRKTEMQ